MRHILGQYCIPRQHRSMWEQKFQRYSCLGWETRCHYEYSRSMVGEQGSCCWAYCLCRCVPSFLSLCSTSDLFYFVDFMQDERMAVVHTNKPAPTGLRVINKSPTIAIYHSSNNWHNTNHLCLFLPLIALLSPIWTSDQAQPSIKQSNTWRYPIVGFLSMCPHAYQ